MDNAVNESRALKLVGGNTDELRIAARRYCSDLLANFQQFRNGAEKALRPGMLAQWKPGMKNRKTPDYDMPVVVVDVLAQPIIDSTFDSGSIFFRERLDIVLGFLEGDNGFCLLHYDSRRFEPYAGIGVEQGEDSGSRRAEEVGASLASAAPEGRTVNN